MADKKKKDIQVTPEDLTRFAKTIRDLLPDLDSAKTSMDSVLIVPGNFKDALDLKSLIGVDDSGRANVYSTHMSELRLALTRFATKLDTMALNYNTTESLNKDLADKIHDLQTEIEPLLPGTPSGG